MAHRHLGRLADVREEIVGDGKLRDLLVVERLARFAENLRSSFDKSHVPLLPVPWPWGVPICLDTQCALERVPDGCERRSDIFDGPAFVWARPRRPASH